MTKLGRKGRSKYKDLQSEDTGRWGEFNNRNGRGGFRSGGNRGDDRFQPDRRVGDGGATGANASVVAERRPPVGAPSGPAVKMAKQDDQRDTSERESQNSYRPSHGHSDRPAKEFDSDPTRPRHSPRHDSANHSRIDRGDERDRRRRRSVDRSHGSRRRSRTRSGSRSPSGRRGYRRDDYETHRERRKRSPSPYRDRSDHEKRRKVDVR